MVIDTATLLLLTLASFGLALHLTSLPEVRRWLGYAKDAELRADARIYSLSLATRAVLRIVTKASIVAIGVLVLLRTNGFLTEPIAPYLTWLSIAAVAALDMDTLAEIWARKYMTVRTK